MWTNPVRLPGQISVCGSGRTHEDFRGVNYTIVPSHRLTSQTAGAFDGLFPAVNSSYGILPMGFTMGMNTECEKLHHHVMKSFLALEVGEKKKKSSTIFFFPL